MAGAGGRPDPWWIPLTLGVLLLGIGVGVLAAGGRAVEQHHVLSSRGVATDAVITAVHEKGRYQSADLVWDTTAGTPAEARDVDVDGLLVVGGEVPLVYDPEHPSDFQVGGVGDGYLAVLWLGGLVALVGTAAVLRGVWRWRGRVRTKAQVDDVATAGAERSRNAVLLQDLAGRTDGARLTAQEALAELDAGRRDRGC